jgi:hypothetical protein
MNYTESQIMAVFIFAYLVYAHEQDDTLIAQANKARWECLCDASYTDWQLQSLEWLAAGIVRKWYYAQTVPKYR